MAKFNFSTDDFSVDRHTTQSNASTADLKTAVSSNTTGTQGRKGQKMPMMNMRFTPENYNYMRREAAVRGMSASKFLNWMIEAYRSNPAHVNYTDDFLSKQDW